MHSARRIGFACLAITSIGWGLNWPVIKILMTEMPPLLARGAAGLLSAASLALVALCIGRSLRVPRRAWRRLAAAAFVNVFVWMGFSTLAVRWLSAGEGALLVYTMPVWATLFAWPLAGERPTIRTGVALALCLLGLWMLFGYGGTPVAGHHAIGIALALAAAVTFAFGTVAFHPLEGMTPLAIVVWQLVLGCLPMIVIGALFETVDLARVSADGWALFAYMTLVPMGACYLAWFAALRRLPATVAASATIVTPAVGVVSGALALGEPLGLQRLIALVVTLSGVALALRRARATTPVGD